MFPQIACTVYNALRADYIGVARGGPAVPVAPLLQTFFNQTTYNSWGKCHDDIVAIEKPLF